LREGAPTNFATCAFVPIGSRVDRPRTESILK
jgi:hypothetical protein